MSVSNFQGYEDILKEYIQDPSHDERQLNFIIKQLHTCKKFVSLKIIVYLEISKDKFFIQIVYEKKILWSLIVGTHF